MNTIHTSLARNGLVRATDGRVIGGVCAGLARKYGMDPWAVRLLLVLTLVAIPGSQILIYPLAWVLMPADTLTVRQPAATPYAGPSTAAYTATPADGPQDVVA